MAISKDKLKEIISASDFDQLIGEVENVWFDCKSQPYQMQSDWKKRELAKDVSSFANAKGGVIFIGIKTKLSDKQIGDEVEEITPFGQELINIIQYKDIIRSWIYPEIEGVRIEWVPIKNNPAKGVVVIDIPVQKNSLQPFLITKTFDEKKQTETIFGYTERKEDNNPPLSVRDLQWALRSGFNYDNQLKERFDELETLIRQNIVEKQEGFKAVEEKNKKESREEVLNNWFNKHQKKALAGLQGAGFNGFLEVKMNLTSEFNFDSIILNTVSRESQIHTFGWPIAVYLDREEYSPKPDTDGIVAEISTKIGNRESYDYWSIKKDGSFYLLKSLFEDERKPGYLFFNTRTIRITEVLMYASNLYTKLGIKEEEPILISIRHGGLKDRIMSAVGNRIMFEAPKCSVPEVKTENIKTSVKEINENMTDLVVKFTKPLFEVFNFFSVDKSIIDDIVSNYRKGIVT